MWLEAPVEEDDGRGGRRRTTTATGTTGRGVPQGGVRISPLLANLYMRRFVLGWKRRGLETRLGAKIVVYADDLVICCRGDAEEAMTEMRRLMTQLALTVDEAKTHIRRLPQERFEFLGYDFGRYFSPKTGRTYLCPQPSKASVKRVIGKIRDATERRESCVLQRRGDGDGGLIACWSAGRTITAWDRCTRRIARSIATPRFGYAGGYVTRTRSATRGHDASRTSTSTTRWGLVQLQSLARSLPRAKA